MISTLLFFKTLRSLPDHLLPSQCLLCASTLIGDLICPGCRADFSSLSNTAFCQQCRLDLHTTGTLCGHCLRQPPAFSRSLIPFAYQYPLDTLIHTFKYRHHLTSGKLLGKLLAHYLYGCSQQSGWQQPDLLIPTPIHWLRRWQRGFNQAEILMHYAAAELGLPFATQIIRRIRRTPSQKELSRLARQKNLRTAFQIAPGGEKYLEGKRVALIDDVVTTTATVRELSRLLIKAGAADVQVWALARTLEK